MENVVRPFDNWAGVCLFLAACSITLNGIQGGDMLTPSAFWDIAGALVALKISLQAWDAKHPV